jgi:hypothetical protein
MQNNLSLQEAFPGIAVATHLVNANTFAEIFMKMSKPFLNKELASKVRKCYAQAQNDNSVKTYR